MSQGALFFIGLIAAVCFILAAAVLARWLRQKLIWTALGRRLVTLGFTNANGTISDLRQGQRYVVTQSFIDYFGSRFEAGEILTYRGQQYIDHMGHAIEFEERTLNLNEKENAELLLRIWAFLEPVRA